MNIIYRGEDLFLQEKELYGLVWRSLAMSGLSYFPCACGKVGHHRGEDRVEHVFHFIAVKMQRETSVSQNPFKGTSVTYLPSTMPLLIVSPSFKRAGGHSVFTSPPGPHPGLSSDTGLPCSRVNSSRIWRTVSD